MAIDLHSLNLSVAPIDIDLSIKSFMSVCTPLIFYMLGIVFYALFVFKFYKWIARRDVLGLHLHKKHDKEGWVSRILKILFYTLENLVLIPLFILFWSAILTVFIIILSDGLTAHQILLSSVALIACVRIAAYYSRNLAEDLGKMIPFTLLALFIFDSESLSFESTLTTLETIPSLWMIAVYYLGFVILLEFLMRILNSLAGKDAVPVPEPSGELKA
jgi:hypothetical protein